MNPEIVKWFNDWFLQNEKMLAERGLKIMCSELSTKYPQYFQSVDIESDNKIGNVIVYDVGTCDTVTFDKPSYDDLGASAEFINSEEEMKIFLEKYVSSLL